MPKLIFIHENGSRTEIFNKEVKSRVILNDFLSGLEYGVYKYKAVIVSGAEHSYIPCDVQFNHIFNDE